MCSLTLWMLLPSVSGVCLQHKQCYCHPEGGYISLKTGTGRALVPKTQTEGQWARQATTDTD